MPTPQTNAIILTMRCHDRPGILARVTPSLFAHNCDIRESGIYGDPDTGQFFIRMLLHSPNLSKSELMEVIREDADAVAIEWSMREQSDRLAVLIAVSKFDHCLRDLLNKSETGALPINIVGVMSNHETLRELTEWHGVPFHHLPITKATKPEQEARFSQLIDSSGAELVVLARYMQILSDEMAQRLSGRCINIHHSFLPSFKGAKPYHQAHSRGVKITGATAHFVTADLDEGPIIEQDVRRVTHDMTAANMVELGREVEASVLSRAVKWHAESRVFLNGSRTVIL